MLDALDGSPRSSSREKVLDVLEVIRRWSLQGLHLFVTSRDVPDVRDSINLSPGEQIIMRNSVIEKDIADYICSRLNKDRRLRKWLPYRDKIQETLANRDEVDDY